jgi:adhesin transport system membrane fusion protein
LPRLRQKSKTRKRPCELQRQTSPRPTLRWLVGISRQQAQTIKAPTDGTILRVLGRLGGEQVNRGEVLAILVPDTQDRAVALYVDGNDAALVKPGSPVRLQFEGWPAVQFSGWPSVAVGTFGGKVAFVDAADDGRGDFRIVVVPDDEDGPWPAASYLRQGVLAKGWVLLNRVSLGFEIWRQFNGFPPTTSPPPMAGAGEESR